MTFFVSPNSFKKSPPFSSEIAGLPLCPLQSGTLDVFSDKRQPFVTAFHELLPRLSEEFLHQSLVEVFASVQKDVPDLLRRFKVKHLAERLSRCLDANHFKTGQPCSVNMSSLPHDNWLALLWQFIEKELRHKSQDTQISEALQCLHQWSLIPCKTAKSGEYMLYPVQDRRKVLFLPHAFLGSSDILLQQLANLSLPTLDATIVCQSLAEKLVGSVKKSESIMHILITFKAAITVPANAAWHLLNYFAQNIGNQPSVNWSCLREIPMFCTISGRTTSLDSQEVLLVPRDIPQAELEVWSQAARITLLDPDYLPDELCQLLGVSKSSNLHVGFWSRLLSTLNHLPQDDVGTHILYIRENFYRLCSCQERQNLFRILSQTAFIQIPGCNRMCRPGEFYSPHTAVFKEMCSGHQLPPKPYCQPEWRDFMEEAGMVTDLTSEMFITFARQVETEGRNSLSAATCRKSITLVNCMFKSDNLRHSGLLSQVREIRFARPWSLQLEHKALAKLCPPSASNRLVSFSESCRSRHWPLLWSAAPLLHPDDEPSQHVNVRELQNVVQQLTFEQNVPLEKFKQHVVKVCRTLTSSPCDILHSGEGRKEVEWLFEQIYEFVTTLQQDHREFLRTLPVVFDSYNGRLLCPEQVVINLKWDEAIDGWLSRAPANYDRFYGLFQSLGVAASVTADHYARVLTKLRAEQQNQPLAGDTQQTCRTAVQGVFRCLQTSEQLNEKVLYLPNEQWCLKESTSLIFNDSDNLRRRLQIGFKGCFLGFEQLGIDWSFLMNLISRLPKQHKTRLLSEITTETIPASARLGANLGVRANEFRMKLSSVGLVNGVTRLLYHQHVTTNAPMATNCREEIRKVLKTIEIVEVDSLCMVLVIDGAEIPDSESYHKILRYERHVHCVLVDSKASFSDDIVVRTLVDVIIEAVSKELSQFRSLLESMLRCSDIQALLDRHGISYFRQTDTCKPGCYVNIDDVCLLQNDVTSLYMDGEDVVMEVFDPLTHTEERGEADRTSHQVCVYARVIDWSVAPRGQRSPPPCCVSYNVDIGYGRRLEVAAIRLYKVPATFDERDSSGSPFTSLGQTADPEPRTDGTILDEIKSCLLVSLTSLRDRRLQLCLLKRLCLQWHPELNTKRRVLCQHVVEVVKQFAHAYNLCTLPGNSAQDHVPFLSLITRQQTDPAAGFFDRVHERGRLFASQIFAAWQGRSALTKQRKRKNPQPGEGRRWLSQAFADLTTAQNSAEKNNWHCLMCHQAAEKALKAVLFHNDADNELLNPAERADLSSLAAAVGNTELTEAVGGLERLTGERWRMCYPFVQWAPDPPSRLYSADTVRSACGLVERIVTTAASLTA